MNDEERSSNVKKINQFVSLVFSSKSSMSLTEFTDFNSSVSSEMFISVIGILHERLPNSQFVFRTKRKFKHDECQRVATENKELNPCKPAGKEKDSKLTDFELMI